MKIRKIVGRFVRFSLSYRSINLLHFRIARFLAMRGIASPLINSMKGYWEIQDRDTHATPLGYTQVESSTLAMFKELLEVLDKKALLIEIGCNAGRNLNYLLDQGYEHLAGIEINSLAVHDVMKEYFPELYRIGTFYTGSANTEIKKIEDGKYDVVFAHSVLIHIEPSERSLFYDMVRISSKYIVIFSQENVDTQYPYDFKKLFEGLGCKEIVSKLFYSKSSIEQNTNHNKHKLPTELYSKQEHFFSAKMVKIFIKLEEE